MEHNSNEIDLIELLVKTYLYLKKYIWVLIIALVLGVVFTILKSKLQKPVYTSSMIIETKTKNDFMYAMTFNEFQNRFEKNPGELIVKIINSANELRKNGNNRVLAERMGIAEDQASKISSIRSNYKYTKGEAISNYVTIIVSSSEQEIFKDLSKGLTNYINNNTYIKNKYISDSIFLTKVIEKVKGEIKELDSLQNNILEDGALSNLFIYKESSIFAENIMLTSLKENLTKELKELNQTKIVEDFYTPVPNSKNLKSSMLINIIIFIIAGFLLIFILILNKKANQYKNLSKKD